MKILKLKRIKISSEQELRNWLRKNAAHRQDIMIVTCNHKSADKHISRKQVWLALTENGWGLGRSYTLRGNLLGHVVRYNKVSCYSVKG